MASALTQGQFDLLNRAPSPASPSVTASNRVPRPLPSFHPLPALPDAGFLDIRSSESSHTSILDNLDSRTLDGLSQPPGRKLLPSLLIWDEKGQTLYDDILDTEDYYPFRIENKLIKREVNEIASTIAASGPDLLVELGAGNMSKTSQLLSSLDGYLNSPLTYYALDVDKAQLEKSLLQVTQRADLHWIKVCGLLGTYEDGAKWLARPEIAPYRRTLVWLGSSIANFEQDEASELLESFAKVPETGAPQNLAGCLLFVDGCQDAARIERAYDLAGGQSRRWMEYGIEAARRHLRGNGDDAEVDRLLADDNWRFEGQWHPERQRYESYLVPTRELVGTIRQQPIRLEKGERVAFFGSGKWTKDTMDKVGSRPGLKVHKSWHEAEFNYGTVQNLSSHLGSC
ncbi:hypothetical protein BT67DRAFT_496404 [Trichocladium antarcticum]|uniref:Histidine-specific methyltransferase SAM-dependent domain-containing protein n=1 Tax=Trichocladium antarcticum TaxID=1450529 RepID=A0AAN6UKD3_9PEZI|nr:hypothetical protein BT67DRAFT_496404 [Trichocladium antarcticum]